jgi:hypothetical protein
MAESIVELVGQAGSSQVAGGEPGPERRVVRRLGEQLSEDQQRALGMLTEGTGIREVGQQLKIHRGTIYRWLRRDPYFRAAYNAWQLEQQESCRAALMKAAEKAVARVIQSIPVHPELAWRVIKELGILSRSGSLSVEPSRVEMEIAVERHEEESELLRRIEREVDREDVPSPRGELARLLSRRQAMDGRDGGELAPAAPSGGDESKVPAEARRE